MWPRNVEAMLAVWLSISPFVFEIPTEATTVWFVDLGAAVLVALLSLSCYWPPLRYAHVGTLFTGLGLGLLGYLQPRPVPSWHENHILVGLLLAMFAVIPNQASLPPEPWRDSERPPD